MASIIVPTSLLFRFVLFKKHYEKYIQLSQKYEEARNMAYYLEEKYHEIKVCKFFFFLCVIQGYENCRGFVLSIE